MYIYIYIYIGFWRRDYLLTIHVSFQKVGILRMGDDLGFNGFNFIEAFVPLLLLLMINCLVPSNYRVVKFLSMLRSARFGLHYRMCFRLKTLARLKMKGVDGHLGLLIIRIRAAARSPIHWGIRCKNRRSVQETSSRGRILPQLIIILHFSTNPDEHYS